MRAHAAFYTFAMEVGTPFAKEHARGTEVDTDDSAWLSSCDGKRLRALWLALQEEDRAARMLRTPDAAYDGSSTGIVDRRTRDGNRADHKSQKKISVATNIVISPSITVLDRERLLIVNHRQREAFVSSQIEIKRGDYKQAMVRLAEFLRYVGAEIMLKLPVEHREIVADVLEFRIQLIRTLPDATESESLMDLQGRCAVYKEVITSSNERYAQAARSAFDLCAASGLPDLDPKLPSNFFSRSPSHSTYEAVHVHPAPEPTAVPTTASAQAVTTVHPPVLTRTSPAEHPPAPTPGRTHWKVPVTATTRVSQQAPVHASSQPMSVQAVAKARPRARVSKPKTARAPTPAPSSADVLPSRQVADSSPQTPGERSGIASRAQSRRRPAAAQAAERLARAAAESARQLADEARNRSPSNMIPEEVASDDSDDLDDDEGRSCVDEDPDTMRQLREAQERAAMPPPSARGGYIT